MDLDQCGGKVSKKPLDDSEDIFDKDKDPEEMTLQELIDAQPDHWKKGKAGDGKIYLNDDGEKVKLNVKGYPYKIGDDGRRMFRTSLRPKGTYSPEEWRKLSQSDRNTILKARRRSWRRKRPMTKPKDWSKKRRRRQRRRRRKVQRKTKTSQSPRTMKVVMKVRRMTPIQSQRIRCRCW